MGGTILAICALAMVGGALVWWFRRVGRVAIPKNRMPFLAWVIAGGVLALFALGAGGGWKTIVPAGLAIAGTLFVVLSISISRQKSDGAIDVGDSVPVFQALDEDGGTFEGATLAGRTFLIKFFRGHW